MGLQKINYYMVKYSFRIHKVKKTERLQIETKSKLRIGSIGLIMYA